MTAFFAVSLTCIGPMENLNFFRDSGLPLAANDRGIHVASIAGIGRSF